MLALGRCEDAGCKRDGKGACDQAGKKIVYGAKPAPLMGYLVARFTTGPGQIVCDPFMGSGTGPNTHTLIKIDGCNGSSFSTK